MFVITHIKVSELNSFFYNLKVLEEKYLAKKIELIEEIFQFLDKVEIYFENFGKSSKMAEIATLKGELDTIRRGIDPKTVQKMDVPKRELQSAYAYTIIEKTFQILNIEHDSLFTKIEQATELIENILLVALQNNLFSLPDKETNIDQSYAEQIWQLMEHHQSIFLIQKKSRLLVSQIDCILILQKCIQHIL